MDGEVVKDMDILHIQILLLVLMQENVLAYTEGYDGEIVVKLFNHGDEDYEIRVGDKISQLVVLPVLYPEVVIVPHLVNGGPRGSHGFGSTGA